MTVCPVAELFGENTFVDSVLVPCHNGDGTAQAAFPMRLVADDCEFVVVWLAVGTEIM